MLSSQREEGNGTTDHSSKALNRASVATATDGSRRIVKGLSRWCRRGLLVGQEFGFRV